MRRSSSRSPVLGRLCLRLAPLLCGLALLLSGAASVRADTIYRWLDAQGREHFGSSPPPGARQVRELDPKPRSSESSTVNIVSGVGDPVPSTASTPGQPKPETPAARRLRELEAQEPKSIGGQSESQWRSRARNLEQRIASLESNLEYAEDQLSSAYSLGRSAYYQRRVDSLKRQLASAEEDFDRFEDRARELGVPPGWLR